MNKFLLVALLLIQQVSAQVISINPNAGLYGQTLNTTITLANGVLNIGSPPMQQGDIYLKQGTHQLAASSFILSNGPPYNDTVNATFNIPPVIPPGLYDVHVNTYQFGQPIDNVLTSGFTISGNASHAISGIVYYDYNQNGIRDTLELPIPNVHVNINPGNYIAVTDTNGEYFLYADTGTYAITINIPTWYNLTSSVSTYNITLPPDSSGNDFGLFMPVLPNPGPQVFSIYTHPMRCVYTGFSGWTIYNPLAVPETGSITVIHSSNLTYQSSIIAPTSISGDTLYWSYSLNAGMALYNNYLTYNNPPAGDTVWYTVVDSVFIGGQFQGIYYDGYKFVVSCSVDPNDKYCSPPGEGPEHLTLKNQELTYLINFQNTGTDTAFNVQVLDTLDGNLDLTTLQLLGSSHPVQMSVQTNGSLRFTFDNIMLPDHNVDEPGSHGWVQYRISPLANLPDSTEILNTSYIYFDFNAAVVTNTTSNKLVSQLINAVPKIMSVENSFVYPNPVTGNSVLAMPPGKFDLTIYDVNGREIIKQSVSDKYIIDKSKLPVGVYHYRLNNKELSLSGRFIVVM